MPMVERQKSVIENSHRRVSEWRLRSCFPPARQIAGIPLKNWRRIGRLSKPENAPKKLKGNCVCFAGYVIILAKHIFVIHGFACKWFSELVLFCENNLNGKRVSKRERYLSCVCQSKILKENPCF
jgi:hypothetical protein